MAPLTLMKVRGKRGAPKEAKWHSGKQRKLHDSGSTTASSRSFTARSTTSTESGSMRRRRRRTPELSRLEQLPTEILQVIFEYAANLDLPLASPHLASQLLGSQHLYHSLTSIILQPVLEDRLSSSAEIRAAARLMNSRFFTWPFFRSWLREQFGARRLLPHWQKTCGCDPGIEDESMSVKDQEIWTWGELRPNARLAPPMKLLRGPFTGDNVHFFQILLRTFRSSTCGLEPIYAERAREGLEQAISAGARDALRCFWYLGMEPDTELLRLAVIDAGCDKEIVRNLVNQVYNFPFGPPDIDFLDPALWAWAEKAQASGDVKGEWLKGLLKDAARESSRKSDALKDAKSTLPG